MYQYNICLVVKDFEGVCIMRCSSDSPIDKINLQDVASHHMKYAVSVKDSPNDVIKSVRDAVVRKCGVSADLVMADCVVTVSEE